MEIFPIIMIIALVVALSQIDVVGDIVKLIAIIAVALFVLSFLFLFYNIFTESTVERYSRNTYELNSGIPEPIVKKITTDILETHYIMHGVGSAWYFYFALGIISLFAINISLVHILIRIYVNFFDFVILAGGVFTFFVCMYKYFYIPVKCRRIR